MSPLVVEQQKNISCLVLILDKKSVLGNSLSLVLKNHGQVVLVGEHKPQEAESILFLPYGIHIPEIPEEKYTHVFLIIENTQELSDLLPNISKKTTDDKSRLLIVLHKEIFKEETINKIKEYSTDSTIIGVGDIFGCSLLQKKENIIDQIFYNAKNKKSIVLPEMGLKKLYPVEFEDVVKELLKIAFSQMPSEKIIFIGVPQPVTLLGVAHSIQKVDPLLKIDFIDQENPQVDFLLPEKKESVLSEEYAVFQKIQASYEIYQKEKSKTKKEHTEEYEVFTPLVKKKNKASFFNFFLSFILGVIFLPVLTAFACIIISGVLLFFAQKSFVAGNFTKANFLVKNVNFFISLEKESKELVLFEVDPIGLREKFSFLENAISTEAVIANTINDMSESVIFFVDSYKHKKALSKADTVKQSAIIKNSLFNIQELPNSFLVSLIQKDLLEKKFKSLQNVFAVIDSVPYLFGDKTEKTYLILFQNNSELRPGGGFIGSYGLLKIKNNIFDATFSLHDVYDADGQLKGHIEPPFPIRRYLPSEHLYLRDSNFSPDFTKNAFEAALILQKETGDVVDGVIGVDLSFARDLIDSAGGVYVPTYNESVTKENMFLLTEKHAEKNFFPGSSQKKDFLSSLFGALILKLKNINQLKIGEDIIKGIGEKHILFAFSNPSLQDLFTANGFSSSFWDARKEEKGRVNDYFNLSEANLGINKVNYYIDRKISQQVTVDNSGSILEKTIIDYKNNSLTTQWSGGIYKNYLRIFLPLQTNLISIAIDGQEQKITPAINDFLIYEKKDFITPVGLEVNQAIEGNKNMYGFLVSVEPQAEKKIEISYTLSQKININDLVFKYNLLIFKQPGTENYSHDLSISYPNSFIPLLISEGGKKSIQSVDFPLVIDADKNLEVTFSKK